MLLSIQTQAAYLLIPMDETQSNHLKAYGIAYWILQQDAEVDWLLNYRGGSFLFKHYPELEKECLIRGVSFEITADAQSTQILNQIAHPEVNQDVVKLEKAPKIAVYSPKTKQPWDDAVTLALTYSEIPYDIVYDEEALSGLLPSYDWLHLHHEDFTGQYGKFHSAFKNATWYRKQKRDFEETAQKLGYDKVSDTKLAVAQKIKEFTVGGGFLFAMCSATDSYDIALAAQGVDICEYMFDGDPMEDDAEKKMQFTETFAFENFEIIKNDDFW